ncbi:MAG: tRNA (N(6)-L-threonylcarbamoyladenosine(37)-C(2))-methylthiotransferase MtaB [Pirellulaceae bacterium]
MTAKLKTHTLGCKVNQYETQYLREALLGIGFSDADSGQPADLCLVNTCTVTAEGDSKSRQVIRRMHRQNPDARIVVMGCYATRAPDEVSALPGVAEVVTNKRELPDLLGRFGVVDIPNGITGLNNRHRAWVKVQDGCLLRCSYCIIPRVRPEMYSRPMVDVLDEVRRLVDRGYREVVLTGIHLGHYGVDFNQGKRKADWVRLSRLVRDICQIDGDFRVRLSSIEATEVTRELINVMSEYANKVCPHLHVCLQSGSDSVLRRMRRRWTVRHILDRCELIKTQLDRPALTTDVIVGFPGETDDEFEQSLETCRQIGFSKIHMFPFSPRKGTPAAEMPDQVSKSTKAERGRAVREVEATNRRDFASTLIGVKERLLVEDIDADGVVQGTTGRYLPAVATSDVAESLDGQLVDVCIDSFTDDLLNSSTVAVHLPSRV